MLTNCRDPSLFKEVIRGEHVKIELIQISSDFKGKLVPVRSSTGVWREGEGGGGHNELLALWTNNYEFNYMYMYTNYNVIIML